MDEERKEEPIQPPVRTSIQSKRQEYNPYATIKPAPSSLSTAPTGPDNLMKQSGLGIASFILSLAAIVLVIVGIVTVAVIAGQITSQYANEDPQVLLDNVTNLVQTELENSIGQLMLIVFSMFATVGLALVGLILGIIGAFSKNRRKTFSIIGIVLNGLLLLGGVGLFLIGIVMGAANI